MENLTISFIQSDLHWHNPKDNFVEFEDKINALQNSSNLIILPEMFTTGFTMEPEKVADTPEGETLQWMKKMALKSNAVITGSSVIKDKGNYYNRLYWVTPQGTFEQYDKRHLFRMANENQHYAEGITRLVASIDQWKICPLICYDLRFPVWSRNVKWGNNFERTHQYDVLIYVASWPEKRSYAWKNLLIARAIENQCYVLGVNRIGVDGNNISYTGDSVVLNYLGEVISSTPSSIACTETVTLNLTALQNFRKNFPAIHDADAYELNL